MHESSRNNGTLDAVAPALFVLLWSTGFIAGKAGVADSGPLHLLLLRFIIASLLLGSAAVLAGARWPAPGRPLLHTVVAGLLVHAGYLGGVFTALRAGLGAGEVALIVGLQPILTAVCAASLLGEQVGRRRWIGLGLGLIGVLMVISPRLHGHPASLTGLPGLAPAIVGLLAISLGTVYQKRYCQQMDMRSGGAVQYAASALAVLALLVLAEPPDASSHLTWRLIAALTWLVLVLSVGAVGLLYRLLQRGSASRVTALFYLVPAVTALLGLLVFGESLTAVSALGMLLTIVAVALAR